MSENNVEKVLAVLAATRNRDAARALKYFDQRFIQHDPYMTAGTEGLQRYIVDSPQEQVNLVVVRTIQDHSFVVAQLKAEASGTDTFAVYRFEKGLIVEHWAFCAPGAPPNKSGHTQVDGPVEATHLDETEKNRAFARRYYETFHLAGDRRHNAEFFNGDQMIRHEPGVRDGLQEFLHDVEGLMQHRTIDEIKLLVSQGDLTFIAAEGTHESKPCVYVDLYRTEDEKVVEHWGIPQIVPPQSERQNGNSML